MLKKLRLKWKIFIFLLGFSSVLLLTLWLFQTVFLNDMYKFVRRLEMDQAVALVGQNIDSPDLRVLLQRFDEEKSIFVMPANEFTEPKKPVSGKNNAVPETITRTENFILRDGGTVSLTFHAMITPVDATVTTLELQLSVITLLMLLLSVLLALLMSGYVSRPIAHLNESAKLLGKGKYETRFSGGGYPEITELSDTLNHAAGELAKTENLRRELMANKSHDLKTPLALIYSYAEMMHDFPDEVTPGQTQTIMDETKRLTSLVNDVLDMSRLESGWVKLDLREYSLTKSIKETVCRMSELLKKDGCEIVFLYDGDAVVTADAIKITQAVYNLLINAVHYGGTDKKVTVRQTAADGFVKIEITDNGEGIDPEDLPYIWDRYYKADKKHKRPVAGTGLGLSIVKKIFEMHHAEYGAESAPGCGSNFWFKLKRQ